jgi:glutathione S-transferase
VEALLFYTPGTCALACMVALEWTGDPYDVCLVAREERQGDHFRKVNPRGQVPALRADGRVLLEVNAILAHIADRNPDAGLLPPNGTGARDVANQWLSALGTSTHPAFWPFYNPQRYTIDPAGVDGVKAAAVAAIRRELATLDAHLAENEWILGATRSALDPYVFAMARWGVDMLDLAREFPALWRHQKSLAAEPGVRVCVAVERGREPPTPSNALRGRYTLATLP